MSYFRTYIVLIYYIILGINVSFCLCGSVWGQTFSLVAPAVTRLRMGRGWVFTPELELTLGLWFPSKDSRLEDSV